jgi:pyrroline-5-carboxylate reductase
MINLRIGIIGCGSMGSMLLNSFPESGSVTPGNLFVSTRTKEKLSALAQKGINTCGTNGHLVRACDMIFLCMKPGDFKAVLDEIRPELNPEKHIVSIAGSLSIVNIEKIHNGKVSRIIPTFISSINEGITLVCHNSFVTDDDKAMLSALLSSMSKVQEIPEDEFELASILTSCAPGVFAGLFREFIDSAAKYTGMDRNQLTCFVTQTLIGTAKLFETADSDFDGIIRRVATKGGTTEVGVEVLKENLPSVFDGMFLKMLNRQKVRKEKLDEQFNDDQIFEK